MNVRLMDRIKRLEEGVDSLRLADNCIRSDMISLMKAFLHEGSATTNASESRCLDWGKGKSPIASSQSSELLESSQTSQDFDMTWEAYLEQKRNANAAMVSHKITQLRKRKPESK